MVSVRACGFDLTRSVVTHPSVGMTGLVLCSVDLIHILLVIQKPEAVMSQLNLGVINTYST